MIVDVHTHPCKSELFSPGYRKYLAAHFHFPFDYPPERLVSEMDDAGVDKSVIFHWLADAVFGANPDHPYNKWNDWIAEGAERYPDRLIGFMAVDPRAGKEALDEIDRCVRKLGLKGMKLYPPAGFAINDKEYAYPIYDRAQELGIPILLHTGDQTSPPNKISYTRPTMIDDVACDFPDLKIIAAHMSTPWTEEMVSVCSRNRNVYMDIAYTPISSPRLHFIKLLSYAKERVPNQICFATDWPYTHMAKRSLKELVRMIKKLRTPEPLREIGYAEFTQEDKNKILGDNAAKLLGL
jgi:uncharacterized protein